MLALSGMLLMLAAPLEAAQPAALLLPLEGEQVAPDVVEGVAAILAEEIDDRGFKLLPFNRRVSKLVAACASDDVPCLARAADRRGADVALRGTVRLREGELRLGLEAIQVKSATLSGAADEALAGDATALRSGVRRAVVKLLTPDRFTGSLTIGCNVPQATVVVDGQTRGSTPLVAPVSDLAEGSHSIRIEKPGYEPFVQTVEVVYEQRAHLEAPLLRRTDVSEGELAAMERAAQEPEGLTGPGLGPWSWVIAGAGGVVLAGAVAAGTVVMLDAAAIEDRAQRQVFVFPRDTETVTRARTLAVVANALYAAGGVLVVTGVALGVWDLLTPQPGEEPPPPTPPEDDWDRITDPVAAPPSTPSPDDELAPTDDELAPADAEPTAELAPTEEAPGASSPEADALPEGDL